MFDRLGSFVSRYWIFVILFWILLALGLYSFAPDWDAVTHDGDLKYLPDRLTSVRGEKLIAEAFPDNKSKSQVILVLARKVLARKVLARKDNRLTGADYLFADKLAVRFHVLHGAAAYKRASDFLRESKEQPDPQAVEKLAGQSKAQFENALEALDKALELFESADGAKQDELLKDLDLKKWFAAAFHNRGLVLEKLRKQDLARHDRADRDELLTGLDLAAPEPLEGALSVAREMMPSGATYIPIFDVWTFNPKDPSGIGKKLRSRDKHAMLIVAHLGSEFMATQNILVLKQVNDILNEARRSAPEGLELGISGSAAIGGDMLASAKESIDNTELTTIILVITILLLVYRAPVLVCVPLATITTSIFVSTKLVAALTQVDKISWWDFSWWDFKIFTTTEIFIIVILFGAGTDFCLFLISRYKEELEKGLKKEQAIARALGNVGSALTASALTTIFGLGMMYFASFGKYSYSGPAIALCLAVTLGACLTLAPAILRAFGSVVFWPFGIASEAQVVTNSKLGQPLFSGFWRRMAHLLTARPGLVLVLSMLLLMPFAYHGFRVDNYTYDLLNEMDPGRSSVQGTQLLQRHFSPGETGPVTVLAQRENGQPDENQFGTPEGKTKIQKLSKMLLGIQGVKNVRSLSQPLGASSKKRMFPRNLVASANRRARDFYFSEVQEVKAGVKLQIDVARFDLILDHDPFSKEAVETLGRIDENLLELRNDAQSDWAGTEFDYVGTTAGIRDLKAVTQSDQKLIQRLVVIAVLAILILILKRPVICLYLIFSVLFSYFVTLGATEWIFALAYGDSFQGLDWKVPIYLFVILIAVGQDYNIYLVTRIFEEQKRHGYLEGLRVAVASTGGIITSCGVIMAGTFFSMWIAGTLRGMLELGIALSMGVMLDTFVVRPILVPAFLALLPAARNQLQQANSIETATDDAVDVKQTIESPEGVEHSVQQPVALKAVKPIQPTGTSH